MRSDQRNVSFEYTVSFATHPSPTPTVSTKGSSPARRHPPKPLPEMQPQPESQPATAPLVGTPVAGQMQSLPTPPRPQAAVGASSDANSVRLHPHSPLRKPNGPSYASARSSSRAHRSPVQSRRQKLKHAGNASGSSTRPSKITLPHRQADPAEAHRPRGGLQSTATRAQPRTR